jgi:hypothetical protein
MGLFMVVLRFCVLFVLFSLPAPRAGGDAAERGPKSWVGRVADHFNGFNFAFTDGDQQDEPKVQRGREGRVRLG